MSTSLLVATRKGLFRLNRSERGQWKMAEPAFLGQPVTMTLWDSRDESLYVAVNLGHFGVKLHRSLDDGRSWTEIGAPAYPPQPETLPEHPSGFAKTAPWTLVQIWSLESDGAEKAGGLWAGTIPGGLFHSSDRGESWTLIRSLWDRPERLHWFGGGYDYPGIHSICVDPRDRRHVTVAVSCGGVWASLDGGEAWECRAQGMRAAYMPPESQNDPNLQDPHRLVQCAANPDALWVQHHNGIYHSVDGARSWQEIGGASPSNFGFGVAAHPKDPETAWFVPATSDEIRLPVEGRVAVTRTRDGGKSFSALSKGLPQENACDLIYRHGLAIDQQARSMAIGSTTGALWTSEDLGDSWALFSAHLPPIYCVRFQE